MSDAGDIGAQIDERYSRQILFREIGREGQEKLLASRVLIVGCGSSRRIACGDALGAGVGHLRIVDRDFVEFTNLQRQTFFKESDAMDRLPKAVAAKARLAEINSGTDVEAIVADVNNSNVEQLITDCDVVLDGTDNFQVRYLLNDACVKHSIRLDLRRGGLELRHDDDVGRSSTTCGPRSRCSASATWTRSVGCSAPS